MSAPDKKEIIYLKTVQAFIDSEIESLNDLSAELEDKIMAEGQKFSLDNPYASVYGGVNVTEHQYSMERKIQRSETAKAEAYFLKKLRNNPYFARVDFEEYGFDEENFYIGIKTLFDEKELSPYVYDWRAPIASLFYEDFEGEDRKFGIDVSFWQGDIDFEAVKEAGCEFVILRIGYSHNGELKTDEQFHAYLEGAKNAGLPVGIYLFVYDNTEDELMSSLDQMFAELGDTQLDLPIAFDWENFRKYQDYEISFQKLNHLYDVFETEVQRRGYESMLYGSKTYLETVWTHTDTRTVWLAQYYSRATYSNPYRIWQCSGSGRIESYTAVKEIRSISSRINLSVFFSGNRIIWLRKNGIIDLIYYIDDEAEV